MRLTKLARLLVPFGGSTLAEPHTIEEVIYSVLSSDAKLASYVSDRIWPDERPQQSTGPALVYAVSSEGHLQSLDGPAGIAAARVEIEAISARRLTARRAANRLRDLIPTIEGTTILGIAIVEVNYDSDESDHTPLDDGRNSPDRFMNSVFLVRYREP